MTTRCDQTLILIIGLMTLLWASTGIFMVAFWAMYASWRKHANLLQKELDA